MGTSPKSFLQKPDSEFKAGLGEVKATTEGDLTQNLGRPIQKRKGAGTPAVDLTLMLKEIYPGLAADAAQDPARMAKAEQYVKSLNTAFKIMKIDTLPERWHWPQLGPARRGISE